MSRAVRAAPPYARRAPPAGSASRMARDMVDLGVFSRMLVGAAAAALAVLSVYAPLTATALLVDALVAGSAGTAMFRLV